MPHTALPPPSSFTELKLHILQGALSNKDLVIIRRSKLTPRLSAFLFSMEQEQLLTRTTFNRHPAWRLTPKGKQFLQESSNA